MSDELSRQWAASAAAIAPEPATPEELWAVARLATTQSGLADALTDPARERTDRAGLVDALFGGKLGGPAREILRVGAGLDWPSPPAFLDALSSLAVDVFWRQVDADGERDEVRQELAWFIDMVRDNPDLGLALAGAGTDGEARYRLLDGLVGAKVRPATMRLLRLAATDEGAGVIPTLKRWLEAASGAVGRLRVRVVSAVEPTPAQLARLDQELTRIYGQGIDLENHLDPGLIGGMVVRIGNEEFDGTVAARLREVRAGVAG